MNTFSSRSLEKLKGVHPLLVKCAGMALERSTIAFQISEGVRSLERQKQLYEARLSRTMASKHLDGRAIDIFVVIDGKANWDLKNYAEVNKAFQSAAKELGIIITWGGSWKSIIDGVHFQIEV